MSSARRATRTTSPRLRSFITPRCRPLRRGSRSFSDRAARSDVGVNHGERQSTDLRDSSPGHGEVPLDSGASARSMRVHRAEVLSERPGFKSITWRSQQGEVTALCRARSTRRCSIRARCSADAVSDLRALLSRQEDPRARNFRTLAEGLRPGHFMRAGVCPRRAEGSAGLVDRHGQEDRPDAGREGTSTSSCSPRTPLWRGLPRVLQRTHGTFSES